jgi:NAD(P)-dependent dehydrogenase (short-subunit alcohol dehydrogenase family)
VGVNYARNREAAHEVVAAVERSGGHAIAVHGDVSAEHDVLSMFDAVEHAFRASGRRGRECRYRRTAPAFGGYAA